MIIGNIYEELIRFSSNDDEINGYIKKLLYNLILSDLYENKASLREKSQKDFNIENASYIIGFVGRIVPIKGIDIIIRAMEIVLKIFPNVVLLFVGSGNQLEYYKNMVREKKLSKNIIFTGFQTNAKEIMQIFDVLVFPSIKESFPNTILEAMFVKVPVIASNVDGISEIIEDNKTGILIEPEIQIRGHGYPKYHFNGKLKKITKARAISPEKLSEKIITILKNSTVRKDISENAYKIAVQKYTIERYVEELEAIYFKFAKRTK